MQLNVAEVAELVDAQDLKSCVQQWTCGFDSRLRHHNSTDMKFQFTHTSFLPFFFSVTNSNIP